MMQEHLHYGCYARKLGIILRTYDVGTLTFFLIVCTILIETKIIFWWVLHDTS